jgi:hypothetical protein
VGVWGRAVCLPRPDPCSFCMESKLRMSETPEAGEARNAMEPARAKNQMPRRRHSTLPSVPAIGHVGSVLEGNGSASAVVFERRSLNARSTTLP